MSDIQDENSKYRKDILTRLKRIEGQVRGIQKMVEEDKFCVDILTQISAIRSAINKVGGIILEQHSSSCLQSALDSEDRERVLKELLDTVHKFLKFAD